MKKKLYHTSPQEINQISDTGRFGSSLFFSHKPYFMSVNDNPIIYELETEEDQENEDYLDVNTLPYLEIEDYEKIKPILEEISNKTGLNEDDSLELLSERKDIYSIFDSLNDYVNFYHENDNSEEDEKENNFKLHEKLKRLDLHELSWDLQKYAAKAAKILGFKGAKLFDEQGTSYLIDMLGREKELKRANNGMD